MRVGLREERQTDSERESEREKESEGEKRKRERRTRGSSKETAAQNHLRFACHIIRHTN